jgi:hypothetical protein
MENENNIPKEIDQFMHVIPDKLAASFVQEFAGLLNSIKVNDVDFVSTLMASALCCCTMSAVTMFCCALCRCVADSEEMLLNKVVAVNCFKDTRKRLQEYLQQEVVLQRCIEEIAQERVK